MATTLIVKMVQGDYDANDVVEPDERVDTHLFYIGTGFGCNNMRMGYGNVTLENANFSASGSSS